MKQFSKTQWIVAEPSKAVYEAAHRFSSNHPMLSLTNLQSLGSLSHIHIFIYLFFLSLVSSEVRRWTGRNICTSIWTVFLQVLVFILTSANDLVTQSLVPYNSAPHGSWGVWSWITCHSDYEVIFTGKKSWQYHQREKEDQLRRHQ